MKLLHSVAYVAHVFQALYYVIQQNELNLNQRLQICMESSPF